MAHKAKMTRKNKVVPCSDANQKVKEHNALVAHKREVAQKRQAAMMEQYRQMMMKAQQQNEANNTEAEPVPAEASIPSVFEEVPVINNEVAVDLDNVDVSAKSE